MKVIPSTYQQMVSYLIEDGHFDLFGSQLVEHQYYQVARKSGSTSGNELPIKQADTEEQ